MFDARVTGSERFAKAVNELLRNRPADALQQLTAMRGEFENDLHSTVEIDRWIARSIQRLQKYDEALLRLQCLEPKLKQLGYDMSTHYLQMVDLFWQLGRIDDLTVYCGQISGDVSDRDALGHLDWMQKYVSLTSKVTISSLMHDVLATAASQLGFGFPPSQIDENNVLRLVELYLESRNSANMRYHKFVCELQRMRADSEAVKMIDDWIANYVQHEKCPIFRDMARLEAKGQT